MYLPFNASRARLREAENARRNRLEIVKALADGQISRRDLFKWGIFTSGGMLAAKNGLSVFAPSAYGQVPTGTPRSPLFGALPFTQPMRRAKVQTPYKLAHDGSNNANWRNATDTADLPEFKAKRVSWHDDFTKAADKSPFVNPVTLRGPIEGRPDGEQFAHQRWTASGSDRDLFPKVGYLMSIGQCKQPAVGSPNTGGTRFHPLMPAQNPNSSWSFGARSPGYVGKEAGSTLGEDAPCLFKLRYGEPAVMRIYNDLPADQTLNGGFGRNQMSTHFHNAHHGAESDGASNAYHFPGTFYDYHWSLTLARRDMPSMRATTVPRYAERASGPDDGNGLVRVEGDFRELQGSLWLHDHRFFFTAENVHKGIYSLANIYSGPDRGCETVDDGINLRLPSGWAGTKRWGNTDFDVNLAITNPALAPDGQLFFDIFDNLGFLGDMLCVNGAYKPYFEVLPRRYRFRILNAAMARFIKLALVVNKSAIARGTRVPFHFIANDGNLVVNPLKLSELDEQGVGERYDIVVDFRSFRPGDSIYLTNLMKQTDGRRSDGAVTVGQALAGDAEDPTVGPILEFRVVSQVDSVDAPGNTLRSSDPDVSTNFADSSWTSGLKTLTRQIPVVAPVRTRVFVYDNVPPGDSRGTDGQCIPDCRNETAAFPWSVSVNGQAAHSLNANRISALIPKHGEVEHWILRNGGGGWDHPIHLHFEEGVTIDRGTDPIPTTERLVRKDVWRLKRGGEIKVQVRFGEFGGAYVNHCHNLTHEDLAMLLRMQVLSPPPGDPNYKGSPQYAITKTPRPTVNGVVWDYPEPVVLPEGDPRLPGTTG
jgi:FtsP/CotA-like multicopper oxidase with cupredoxin domain